MTDQGPDDGLDRGVLDDLRRCLGPDATDVIRELVTLFLKEARLHLDEARAALSSGDGDRLVRAAHRVHGSSGYVGARAVATTSAEIERRAERGCLGGLDVLVDRLRDQLDAVDRALLT